MQMKQKNVIFVSIRILTIKNNNVKNTQFLLSVQLISKNAVANLKEISGVYK